MYGHDNTFVVYPYTDHLPLLDMSCLQPNTSPQCLTTSYDGEPGLDTMGFYNIANGTSNEGASYVSPRDLAPGLLPRSVSSHSLQNNNNNNIYNNGWFSRMGLVSEVVSENDPVRRVFSAGDLQINGVQNYSRSESPLSSESSSIIESMTRASPYSPEEKKERIERYRNKRSQRNFTKKIKYECRKTLADSRPRVKGRFARNDEIEKSSQSSQWSHECVEEDYEDHDDWLTFLDSFPANLFP